MIGGRGYRAWSGLSGLIALLAATSPRAVLAQPVLDRFVSDAQVVASRGCATMTVVFNVRVRYGGHFPLERSDDLRISLQPVDREALEPIRAIHREGVNVVDGASTGVRNVFVETDAPGGPVLRIQFDRPTSYKVVQSGSFENLTIVFATTGSDEACRTDTRPGIPAAARISAKDFKFIEASMDEARAALEKGARGEAIKLLEAVLKFPENEHTQEARDLLSKATGRATPGPSSAQVRTPTREQAELADYLLREGLKPPAMARPLTANRGDDATLARTPRERPRKEERREGSWSLSGSVSHFYVRDDSVDQTKNIAIAPDPNADPDAHRVHQNTFLTNFDLYGTIDSENARTKIKLSGTDEHRIQSSSEDANVWGISTAFLETTLRETDLMARIGRQTRNTGGVIGRFDGGLLSWAYNTSVRFNAVAGGSNWSRYDAPFKDGRFLIGTSVDIAKIAPGLDASLFVIQQNARGLIDRRAIGVETRYFDQNKSALGTLDYDVHFGKLNAAIFSGSYTFNDKSVLAAALDYRRVPYLSSWNALQGQPYLTLYDMLKYNTQDDVRRFAVDRTPVFKSAMASYSHPINDNFQVSADATVTQLSGTPPSGGVDGTFPSGTEYYLSAQVLGTSLLRTGDMYALALRYAHLADSRVYFFDINSRYPWSQDLSFSPRFRAGWRSGTTQSLRELTLLPSLLVDYNLTKDVTLEGEVGHKRVWSNAAGVNTVTKDYFVTLGLRSSFTTEGAYRCAGVIAPCIGLVNGAARGPDIAGRDKFYTAPGFFMRPDKDASAPVDADGFLLEVGIRGGMSAGHNAYDYFADETSSQRVSRLAYQNLNARTAEGFFRLDARRGIIRDFFLKGYAGAGKISHGSLADEDFPPFVDYSKTMSSANGRLAYGAIDLGYNVFTNQRMRVGAFAGFHSWLESVNASGCTQVAANPFVCGAPIPNSVKVVNERDRWRSVRVGAVLDLNLTDRLSWNAEFAFASLTQRARDTHYFTFGEDPAKGSGAGFEAESILKYRLTDDLIVGAGARWWRYKTSSIDAFDQLLRYRTDRFNIFGQASYRFHFGADKSVTAAKPEP
ncbi:MAG: hypothetical protein KGM42_18065 [Hyphomicrobiales bacterium]|nr:hypothetical protein [Hyphomicrobiales bacterium]